MKDYSKKTPKKLSRFRTPSLYLIRKIQKTRILKVKEKLKREK